MKKINNAKSGIDYRTLTTQFCVLLDNDVFSHGSDLTIAQKDRIKDLVLGLMANSVGAEITDDASFPASNCIDLIKIDLIKSMSH